MEPYTGLVDALARIGAAASLPTLWATVKDFASLLGYSHIVAMDAGKLADGSIDAVLYSDAPLQLFREIDRRFGNEEHPLVRWALHAHAPFTISEMRSDPKHKGQRWGELLADIVKRGDALVVPVYDHGEPSAGLSFGGVEPDTSPRSRAMLQVVAHAATEKARDLKAGKGNAPTVALSVREAQCLRLVAVGKADAEIGKALGISARTVRFHVDSAKTKLGVANRIQAVAKALRERIIAV
jgi:DNA-binding CsgD family transcriptional regulator